MEKKVEQTLVKAFEALMSAGNSGVTMIRKDAKLSEIKKHIQATISFMSEVRDSIGMSEGASVLLDRINAKPRAKVLKRTAKVLPFRRPAR